MTYQPKISVGIMHVPGAGRDSLVEDILRVLPKDWDVSVIEDPERKGCWSTAKRAWETRSEESTHHLVLSDDAVLCDYFPELLIGAITARPEAVMSLCTRQKEPVDRAVVEKCSWVHSNDVVYGQAIVIPSKDVQEMLDWVEKSVKPEYKHDDGRVGMWARVTTRGIYTPVPQLVRHAPGKSLVGHRAAEGLGTPLFAGNTKDVNWDTDAVEDTKILFGSKWGLIDTESFNERTSSVTRSSNVPEQMVSSNPFVQDFLDKRKAFIQKLIK